MKNLILDTRLNTAILLIAISAALSSYADPPFPPPGGNVTVVNTPDNPVPVVQQGPVAIEGDVTVSGTPNVNVANTANVNIANTVASPVPVRAVDSSTVQPIDKQALMRIVTEYGSLSTNLYTVPDGKRLVIEYVSFGFQTTPGTKVVITQLHGMAIPGRASYRTLVLIPVFTGTQSGGNRDVDNYLVGQSVKFYAEPGQDIVAFAQLSKWEGEPGDFLGWCGFSGYLVNVP